MKEKLLQKLADMLYNAERYKLPVPPLTQEYGGLSLDDAYAIQLKNVERSVAAGHVISGKKIGLTSPGIQRQMSVSEPDYGHLFSSMECRVGIVDSSQLISPRIEAELAFMLSADLSGGEVTADEVRRATEYVTGAFEIVDSRVADWNIKLVDTVADNASSGRYILGEKRLSARKLNLKSVSMRLYKNGVLAETGVGANVLGDPCASVAWLANRLWSYGVTLKKGEIVLSGAFSAAPPARRGDVFVVEFSSFGSLTADFV